MDIERSARWTILETEQESSRIVRWRSFLAAKSQDVISGRAVSPPAAISEMASPTLA